MVRVILAIISLGLVLFGMMFFKGRQSQGMQVQLGLINGTFKACPDKPNCVSTMANPDDEGHYLSPIELNQPVYTIKNMVKVIAAKKNMQLQKEGPNYLYYTYKSELIGFVDDIEFAVIDKKLHVRSASRVGHSDLGANRKRVAPILEEVKKLDINQ